MDRRKESALAVETGARVRLKASGPQQKLRALSGGNQQKVMFARAILGSPRALLLDEPTRGVDVGAKYDIYALLRELAAAGAGVLVASTDLDELLQICSRILIMRQGRLAARRADRRSRPPSSTRALLWRDLVLMSHFLSRFGTPLGFVLLFALLLARIA